jgi:hypothetical protein
VSRYIDWAQIRYEDLFKDYCPSPVELKRILRGLYRFQLFCNLFGSDGQSGRLWLSAKERHEQLLDKYEPWEIEEFFSIHLFVENKYKRVLVQVTDDLNPDSSRFDAERTSPFTPPGAYYIGMFGQFPISALKTRDSC